MNQSHGLPLVMEPRSLMRLIIGSTIRCMGRSRWNVKLGTGAPRWALFAVSLCLAPWLTGCDGGLGLLCGGISGGDCTDGQYCRYVDGSCGDAGTLGICVARPDACTLEVDPVCGCDGETYSNACQAASAGVSVETRGECSETGDDCGGIQGLDCSQGQYCRFPLGTCGAADQTGTCQDIPDICTEEFAPVCGCDGETYDNQCFAAAAGVSIVSNGECDDDSQGPG